MRTTIKDIAQHTNVSVTTVSQILNGKGKRFSKKTIQRVLEACEELNYSPNKMASALITGRTNTLGIILPDIRNPFFGQLARGIDDRAYDLGYTVMLSNSSDSHEKDICLIKKMQSHFVDGILFCMAGNSTKDTFLACIRALTSINIPYVLIDRSYADCNLEYDAVVLDHEYGAYLATEHLIELGHKKIACISGPKNLPDSTQRINGYVKAMKDNMIEIDNKLIYEGDYHEDSGYQAVRYLIGKEINHTAVFACNDLMALGAITAYDEANINIPEDISIVGYDDITFSKLPKIRLTTVKQPITLLGCEAVNRLIEKISPSIACTPAQELKPKLILRDTTAIPSYF